MIPKVSGTISRTANGSIHKTRLSISSLHVLLVSNLGYFLISRNAHGRPVGFGSPTAEDGRTHQGDDEMTKKFSDSEPKFVDLVLDGENVWEGGPWIQVWKYQDKVYMTKTMGNMGCTIKLIDKTEFQKMKRRKYD